MFSVKSAMGCLRLACLAAVMAILGGCALVDESRVQKDDKERIPWNSRADWEGSVIGVPQ